MLTALSLEATQLSILRRPHFPGHNISGSTRASGASPMHAMSDDDFVPITGTVGERGRM